MLVCLYEDRPQQVPGLKLLILSLRRYCPSWPVRLRFPAISDNLRVWLASFPNVTVIDQGLNISGSYNIKPTVLLDGLSTTDECIWLDTDVLVNGDLAVLERIPPEVLIVTQDPWEYSLGSTYRCATWGLSAGRELDGPLNSAVVRVTRRHRELLSTWQQLVSQESYLREQQKPAEDRNHHLLSDQDALSAILASENFKNIPVRRLFHSSEILQHQGAGAYGLRHRWQNLQTGLPPLLHAMGKIKPWRAPVHPRLAREFRDYYERTYLELSPYVHIARQYRSSLDEDTSWTDIQTVAGRLGSIAALGHPCLKGAVQATMHRAFNTLGKRS
jgi:hypothetical protein